jgi:hypothetical protein
MSHFDPTDPAAEIAYLKALEKAKTPSWPVMPPAVDKLKKPLDTPVGKAKKPPRHVARTWGALTPMDSRPFVQGGIAPADMARALLILSLLLALALAVD